MRRPLTRRDKVGARHAGEERAVAHVGADPVGRGEDRFEHLVAMLERELERGMTQSALDQFDQGFLIKMLDLLGGQPAA